MNSKRSLKQESDEDSSPTSSHQLTKRFKENTNSEQDPLFIPELNQESFIEENDDSDDPLYIAEEELQEEKDKQSEERREPEKIKTISKKRKRTTSKQLAEHVTVEETDKKKKVLVKKRTKEGLIKKPTKNVVKTEVNKKKKTAIVKKETEEDEETEEFKEKPKLLIQTDKLVIPNVLNPNKTNIFALVLDEIALEGLDGITIEALWTRLNIATNYTLDLNEVMQNTIWDFIKVSTNLDFFELPTARPKLIAFKRNEERIKDPTPHEDIYPFHPVDDKENKIIGSCSNYETRKNITSIARCMNLSNILEEYGRKFVIVANQTLRCLALYGETTDPRLSLSEHEYYILERIGRSRYEGELTTGPQSLQVIVKETRSGFYFRKTLKKNHMIIRQNFEHTGSNNSNIFVLAKFHTERKSIKQLIIEQMIGELMKHPQKRMSIQDFKRLYGMECWVKFDISKVWDNAEFRQYVTVCFVPYRELHPNASSKEYLNKYLEERRIKMLELIKFDVNISALWKEDPKRESSDDEYEGDVVPNKSLMNQVYNVVYDAGLEGLTLKEVARKLSLDYYSVRGILRILVNNNFINQKLEDFKRQRYTKYTASCLSEDVQPPIKKEKPTLPKPNQDTLSHIANVLGIDSNYLTPLLNDKTDSESDVSENENETKIKKFDDEILGKKLSIAQKRKTHHLKMYKFERNQPLEYLKLKDEVPEYEKEFQNTQGYINHEKSLQNNLIKRLETPNAILLTQKIKLETQSDEKTTQNNYIMPDYNFENKIELCKNKNLIPIRQNNYKSLQGNIKNCKLIFDQTITEMVKMDYVDLFMRTNELLDELKVLLEKNEFYAFKWPHSDIEDLSDEDDVLSIVANVEGDAILNKTRQKSADYIKSILEVFDSEQLPCNLLESKLNELPNLQSTSVDVIQETKPPVVVLKEEDVDNLVPKEDEKKLEEDIYYLAEFMGSNPVLKRCLEHCDVTMKIYISTPFLKESPIPLDEKLLTEKVVKRCQMVLEFVDKEEHVLDVFKLLPIIASKEVLGKPDKRSVWRILGKLMENGHIKLLEALIIKGNTVKTKSYVVNNKMLEEDALTEITQEIKLRYFIGFDTIEESGIETPKKATSTPNVDIPYKVLNDNYRDKDYGYCNKFAKAQVLHEFLTYLTLDFSKNEAIKGQNVLQFLKKTYKIDIDESSKPLLSTIYSHSLDWKMFVPPILGENERSNRWLLYGNILMRLPLSIFVKLVSIRYKIPELLEYLKHPVKKHCLILNLPEVIRNTIFYNRKHIFSVYHSVQMLVFMGLVQVGPCDGKEKENMYLYLNQKVHFFDTSTSTPGYTEIEDKTYEKLSFEINSLEDCTKYWNDLWHVSMNSRLGLRQTSIGKYVISENLFTKPCMVDALKPVTFDGAPERDVGYIIGDGKGAAKMDSAMFIHIKRNWVWVSKVAALPGPSGVKKKIVKKKEKKKKKFGGKSIVKKVVLPVKKHVPVVKKILPRKKEEKARRVYYDEIDNNILKTMGQNKASFVENEDKMLCVIRTVSQYLCPVVRKKAIPFTTIRDLMHISNPKCPKKTSRAYQRRMNFLYKSDEMKDNKPIWSYSIYKDEYVQKYFRQVRNCYRKGRPITDNELSIAFIYLMDHIYKKYVQDDAITSKKSDFLNLETIKIFEEKLPEKSDVQNELLKTIIHSFLLSRIRGKDDLNYKLFSLYKKYTDGKIRVAAMALRDVQIISGSKIGARNDKKGMSLCGMQYQLSSTYFYKQITNYPYCVLSEAYQYFLGILKYKDIAKNDGICIDHLEQGHGIGLVELFTVFPIELTLKIPLDMLTLVESCLDYSYLVPELANRYKTYLKKRFTIEGLEYIPEMFVEDSIDDLEVKIEDILRKSFSREKYAISRTFNRENLEVNSDLAQSVGEPLAITVEPMEIGEERRFFDETMEGVEFVGDTVIFPLPKDDKVNSGKVEMPSLANLSLLLNQGAFPEMDKDGEKLKKINAMFELVEPSIKIHIFDDIEKTEVGKELMNFPKLVEDVILSLQSRFIISSIYPSDDKLLNTFSNKNWASIEEIQQIIESVKAAGDVGIPAQDLTLKFPKISPENVLKILNSLFELSILFRGGSHHISIVHFDYREEYCLQISDTSLMVKMTPFVHLDGQFNIIGFEAWLKSILAYCLSNPYAPINNILKRYNNFNPADVFFLLEVLQELKCITLMKFKSYECDLFSTVQEFEEDTPATFLDSLDDIFIKVDSLAALKMGCFLSRNKTDDDSPFDDQFQRSI